MVVVKVIECGLGKLTARQSGVLGVIRASYAESGVPPTYGEIATAMGLSNRSGVVSHLRALKKKGWVRLDGFKGRAVRLVGGVCGECGGLGVVARPDPSGLPAGQRRCLEVVVARRREIGACPTVREVGALLKVSATGAASHLQSLVRKGFLVAGERSLARSFRLAGKTCGACVGVGLVESSGEGVVA